MPIAYTLTAPSPAFGIAGYPSAPFTVTLGTGTLASPATVTPSDGSTGTFTPPSVILTDSARSASFTYTPPGLGTRTVATPSGGALTDPAGVSYKAARSFAEARSVWERQMAGLYPGQAAVATPAGFLAACAAPAGLQDLEGANHYDPIRTYRNVRRYLGLPAYDAHLAAARYQYRDLYAAPSGYPSKLYHYHTPGMRLDWELDGDAASRDTVALMANGGYAATSYAGFIFAWQSSREVAFALLARLDGERVGVAHHAVCDSLADSSLRMLVEWVSDPAKTNVSDPCLVVQPFMTGITMQALIAYWDRHRGSSNATAAALAARVPAAIGAMLDYLRAHAWFPTALAFSYWDRSTAPMQANGACFQGIYDNTLADYPFHIVDPLIAHAFAWYAWQSGDPAYARYHDEAFVGQEAAGGDNDPVNYPLGYHNTSVDTPKEYNETYGQGSAEGLRYRDRALVPWPVASAYTLTAPSPASGRANQLSRGFVVRLAGGDVSVPAPVTVTPSDGGAGGAFVPPAVVLTADEPLAVFRYAPAAARDGQSATISVANNGGLADPTPVPYAVSGVAPLATSLTFTPPATANGPAQLSPDWTVALSPAGSVPPRSADAIGGAVPVFFGDSNSKGTWLPSIVTLSAETPAGAVQYNPTGPDGSVTGPRLCVTSPYVPVAGLAGSPPVTYTPAASPTPGAYTLSGPSSGRVGTPATFTVSLTDRFLTAGGAPAGTVAITPSDGAGGTFSPPSASLWGARRSATFAYTPAAAGARSVSTTNTRALADPPAASFAAASAGGTLVVAAGGGMLSIAVG